MRIPIGGVNIAQLEAIDVGVGLKLIPNQVRADGAQFRVEADRSFFSDQGIGQFTEGIALFKQSVAATADVKFGETLILSGLSEDITDGQNSGVPVIKNIPVLSSLFSNDSRLRRGRSVIILVTPSRPAVIERGRDASMAVQRLVSMWDQVIERQHGIGTLASRIKNSNLFTRAAAEDAPGNKLQEPHVMKPLLRYLEESG